MKIYWVNSEGMIPETALRSKVSNGEITLLNESSFSVMVRWNDDDTVEVFNKTVR